MSKEGVGGGGGEVKVGTTLGGGGSEVSLACAPGLDVATSEPRDAESR